MSVADTVLDRRYNDDLLTQEDDRQSIKILFSEIVHLLDHPELRIEFESHNTMANKAKAWVHRLGLAAIILATLALLSAAVSPILKAIEEGFDLSEEVRSQFRFWQSISIYIEIAGLLGSFISIGGLWISKWKKTWLQARLMTEKLRAWHFQMLIHRGEEIEASCNVTAPDAITTF